jgi:copper chaperone NosL
MHIGRPGFGGEIRDAKGLLTKYDDIGCLLAAYEPRKSEAGLSAWVEDHERGVFVPLDRAVLVHGDPSSTPMGSGIVAFERREEIR